nr:hypothetical transcript [Hymenolepis microstoma]
MDSNRYGGCSNKTPCAKNYSGSPIGARTKDLRKRIRQEVENELSQKVDSLEPTDYRSKTMIDFCNNFVSPRRSPDNLQAAELSSGQPVTFWIDNYATVTGVTQRSGWVKPFRRSNNFSCPIECRMNDPQHITRKD